MSKLADQIRRATRIETAPIGFAAAAARTRTPSLLLGIQIDLNAADQAKAAVEAGADVLLLTTERDATQAQGVMQIAGTAVVGLQPASLTPEVVEQAKQAGIDFLVIDAEQTPASMLLDEALGFVLLLSGDFSDALLRTIESLPIDAVLFSDNAKPLTIRRQLELRRLAGLTQKPLLLSIPPEISAAELEALRESGAVGVVVDAAQASALDRLSALRSAIDGLPPRRRRREEAPTPILPRVATAPEAGEEEEAP